ncbi:MAG: sulfatase [Candidatus Hydrogenedentes bacterium]|nr:sulfatase [Candidatus Hydrogenedentota bacterium]
MTSRSSFHNTCLLLCALTLLIIAPGCGGRSSSETPGDRVLTSLGLKTADGRAIVHRFTTDHFTAQRSASHPPYVIPAKSMVMMTKSRPDQAKTPQRPGRKEGGKLFLVEGPSMPTVTAMLGLGIRAEDYNELRIRMRVSRGSYSTLSWTTDVEPSSMRAQGLTIPIFADNEIHTYRVPLGALETQTWVGTVKSIVMLPSDSPANVEIESMELGFVPQVNPARITIAAQTHEAVFGTQAPWEFVVPENAVFTTHIGLPEETWSEGRKGSARFIATLDTDSEKGILLLDESLTPGVNETHQAWLPFKADLSKFAGQTVRIAFNVSGIGEKSASPACWGDPLVHGGGPDSTSTPIILISCDTLRADHLSCYGYERETSPNLDAFAKDAVLFENAITPETWTLPSHATMFTGLYPKHHGVTPNANLAEATLTLPEALRDGGYLCGGYIGFTFWLYPWRGFSHGFDVYNTPEWRFRGIEDTHRLAKGWLGTMNSPNTFLFLHNFDVHSKPAKQYDGLPYGPDDDKFLHFAKAFTNPPAFQRPGRDMVDAEAFLTAANHGEVTLTQEEIDYCVALYDDCIRMVDASLKDLFDTLKERGLYDRALIMITADHGEEFGEHGTFGHGNVYEPSLRIPMIIKFPNNQFAGTRFAPVVELVDLMPTALDAAGLPIPKELDGQSLLRVLNKTEEHDGMGFAQRFTQRTAREMEWKLIRKQADVFELFNIASDPGEKVNVADANPEIVARMREPLENFFAVNTQGWHFAFDLPSLEWKGDLTISAEDVVESAELLGGQDVSAMTISERGVRLNLNRINRTTRDELIVRTVGTAGRLSLTLKSQSNFSIALGDQPVATGTAFTVVLDPATKTYPQPDLGAEPSDTARFRIWYVPQTGTRSAAQQLSPEAIKELEALGYTAD